jgi:hypothetical protein
MKVLCVRGSRFLIKGEWYKVILSSQSQSFQLENHTDIKWNSSWYHKNNFLTKQEFRDKQLDKLLYDNRCDNNNDGDSLYD